MFSNIWNHPRTTFAGVLLAVITIAGVFMQHGVTLGNLGDGSVIGLVAACATALLGLLARDPSEPTAAVESSDTTKQLHSLAILGMLSLCLLPLIGCPKNASQLQQAAQASENAAIIAQGLEQSEIAAHQQGLIPDADHEFVQQEVLALASLGKTTDTCIANAGTAAGALVCINATITAVEQMQADGATHLKSAQAQQDFSIAISGVKAVLLSIQVQLGGPPPAPATN
jgi:hypothetical protein